MGAKLNVSGTGSFLSDGYIGRKLGSQADACATVTMNSGLVTCGAVGNLRMNAGYTEAEQMSNPNDVRLYYEGGSFYSQADDDSHFSEDWSTHLRTGGDVYRIKLPAQGQTCLQQGTTGTLSYAPDYKGYVYAWVTGKELRDNSPLVFYVRSDAGYHRYEASWSSADVYRINGVLSETTDNIGGVTGTLTNAFGEPYAAAALTFTGEDGAKLTATTLTDGSYTCNLPIGTHTVEATIDAISYAAGSVSVTDLTRKTQNLVLPCVRGTVTAQTDGTPLESVFVSATIGEKTVSGFTDAAGAYQMLFPVQSGTSTITITANKLGYASQTKQALPLTGGGRTEDIQLTGSGTLPMVIDIHTEADLIYLSTLKYNDISERTLNICNDIAMSDNTTFVPIIGNDNITVNGNGYCISNLQKPLFKYVWVNTFKDLHLSGDIRYNESTIGAFAMNACGTVFENCSFTGSVATITGFSGLSLGGFVGVTNSGVPNHDMKFINCRVDLRANYAHRGGDVIGGFIATPMHKITLLNCSAQIADSSTSGDKGTRVGGLTGETYAEIIADNCFVNITELGSNPAYAITSLYEGGSVTATNCYYNATEMPSPKDAATVPNGGLTQEAMLAYPGETDALVDKLNAIVADNEDYKTWYPQKSGLPDFAEKYALQLNGAVIAGSTKTKDVFAAGEEVTVQAVYDATKQRFIGWQTTPTVRAPAKSSSNEIATFSMLARHITLTAVYQNVYTLSTPQTPRWDGQTATWYAVEGAVCYLVQFYKDGTAVGAPVYTETNRCEAGAILSQNGYGTYTFQVMASAQSEDILSSAWSLGSPNCNYIALSVSEEAPDAILWAMAGSSIKQVNIGEHVSGGVLPYHYELTDAPDWLSIDENGVLTGTPDAVAEATTISVQISDSNGAGAETKTLSLRLSEVATAATKDENDVWQISEAGQLYWFASQVNNGNIEIKGKLLNDITLPLNNGKSNWTPIGRSTNAPHLEPNGNCFAGSFDGCGYSVKGLYLKNPGNLSGLFGAVKNATISNLAVHGEIILDNRVSRVGGVVGCACRRSILTNLTSYVTITGSSVSSCVGGVVGGTYNDSGCPVNSGVDIIKCINRGSINLP